VKVTLAPTFWGEPGLGVRVTEDTGGTSAKVAVTVRVWVMLTVHWLPLVLSQPVQPVRAEPVAGLAVRTTLVPTLKAALHVLPQVMPAGVELTVPLPEPPLVTVRGNLNKLKVAIQLLFPSMLTRASAQ
jgi:hypothetical protein